MYCSPFILKRNVQQCIQRQLISSLRPGSEPLPQSTILHKCFQTRTLSGCLARCFSSFKKHPKESSEDKKYKEQIKELNKKGLDLEESNSVKTTNQIDYAIGIAKEKQARTPWHREGLEHPPVRKSQSTGAMAKGKLLTTPSKLLKLILPLTMLDKNTDGKVEPLALLVHPQQPLSYLERLIQSELPMIKNKLGGDKVPEVWFLAKDSAQEDENEKNINPDEVDKDDLTAELEEDTNKPIADEKLARAGKINKDDLEDSLKDVDIARSMRGGPGEGGIETYSSLGRETSRPEQDVKFVRWSTSTEIGDFIRDAARGKEFAVCIEGSPEEIRVGVPSFGDRTHYLRVRLRKLARQLDGMALIKKECDYLAHRSAQRLAMAGFGILVAWWASIYHFTFRTDYGWDTMEPITYLAGLATIMISYLYFLWRNREVSYRSALHFTVSRRQNQLYTARGLDIAAWESLVEEANVLRKEIKKVAEEYDVEWDETKDEASEIVHEALRDERKKKERARKDDKDEEDESEDDDDTDEKAKRTEKG